MTKLPNLGRRRETNERSRKIEGRTDRRLVCQYVAEWIGLSDPDKFRQRAKHSESTLAKLGIIAKLAIIQNGAGRPGEEYWLIENP
jgi:hypothetical protein